MSVDGLFTKENLDVYLKELGKEFRKLNGKKVPAEIVLVGGAAILINYGFRESTYDMDGIILASSSMKDAINHVGDRLDLPNGWLNEDFKRTPSFSEKLFAVSTYYKTFSNIIKVRTVAAEYLVAMKLMSGRQYKNDLSDIVGILWEHHKSGNSITKGDIERAIIQLYGADVSVPPHSQKVLEDAFVYEDLESVYHEIRKQEIESKDILMDFELSYPQGIKCERIEIILEQVRRRKQEKRMSEGRADVRKDNG
jgi:hypothetical protein